MEAVRMQAFKLKGRVNSDRTLHLILPENSPEGPVEVIVLIEEESAVEPSSVTRTDPL